MRRDADTNFITLNLITLQLFYIYRIVMTSGLMRAADYQAIYNYEETGIFGRKKNKFRFQKRVVTIL